MPVSTKNLSIFSFSMKKFLLSVLAFGLVIFIFNEITSYFINPFNGSDCFSKKAEFLKNDTTKYNVLTFGSSRLYRAFNPMVFDSILSDNHIKSYNLAAQGVMNPEVFYLMDNFLRTSSLQPEYIFVELISFDIIKKKWDDVPKSFYWERLPYLSFCLKYLANADYPTDLKLQLLNLHTKGFLYKNSRFSQFSRFFKLNNSNKYFGEDERGYLAVEDSRGIKEDRIAFRKKRFNNDLSVLDRIRENLTEEYLEEYNSACLNTFYLAFLNDLIEEYDSKGIQLIFVIPPRADSFLQEIALMHNLPPENFIDMGNPIKYPEFYSFEHTFDKSHLNKSGARLFSNKIARQFKRQIISNDTK